MRNWLRQKSVQYALAAFCTLAALALFWRFLSSFDDLWKSVQKGASSVARVLAPLFWALMISYILGQPVKSLEKLLRRIVRKKEGIGLRICAQLIVFLAAITLLLLIVFLGIPKAANDLMGFLKADYLENALAYYQNNALGLPAVLQNSAVKVIENLSQQLTDQIGKWESTMLSSLLSVAKNIGQVLGNLALAFIFSFYLLSGAPAIFGGWKRFFTKQMGKKRAEVLFIGIRSVDRVFGSYLSAKFVESALIYIICQIAFLLMSMPYGALLSAAIAIANVVPYVGPLAGFALAVLVAAFESPWLAGITALFLIALRFADNLWIAPHIVADRQVLHPFWTLVVVLLGAYVGGILGMFLSVPIAASLKIMYRRWNSLNEHKQEEHNE